MARRKTYREKTIRNYWVNTNIWHGKFNSQKDFLEAGGCFACGVKCGSYIEKAHIKALVNGGEDHPRNIHMLCRHCHWDSELIDGTVYDVWLRSRSQWYVALGTAARYNLMDWGGAFNIELLQEYINSPNPCPLFKEIIDHYSQQLKGCITPRSQNIEPVIR